MMEEPELWKLQLKRRGLLDQWPDYSFFHQLNKIPRTNLLDFFNQIQMYHLKGQLINHKSHPAFIIT